MIQGCEDLESASLNQTPLPLERLENCLLKAQIDQLMPGANRLELQLRADDGTVPQLTGHVWLEIVEPA